MAKKLYIIENWLKSTFAILVIVLIFVGLVYFVTYLFNPFAAKMALVFAIGSSIFYVLLGVLLGPKIVLASAHAVPLEGHPRYEEVKEIVEELCKKAGIPVPKLYLIPGNDINAFATGLTRKNACIAVTEGALKYLTREELKGVLAHEIAHIKNYDMLHMTITSVLVGMISYIANYLQFAFLFGEDERPAWAYALAFIISLLVPLAAFLIQLAISREREYLADATGAMLCGTPEGLISAFRKIERLNKGDLPYHEGLEPLYFVSIEELFSTHPPIHKRIERLIKMFG